VASHYQSVLLRRGELAELDASNPILASGEPAFAVDTNTLKIGNGSSKWSELTKFLDTRDITSGLVTVNVPSIGLRQSYTASISVPDIYIADKYSINISPQSQLPSGISIEHAAIADNNIIAVTFRNTAASIIDQQVIQSKIINNVSIPSIAINQAHTLSLNIPNVTYGNNYSVHVSPKQKLPDGLVISYAYISGNNTVTVEIRNTSIDVIDGGNSNNSGSPTSSNPAVVDLSVFYYISDSIVLPPANSSPFSVDLGVFCCLIQSRPTTTTTTTTTLPPVSNEVFGFGYNEFGQLGTSDTQSRNEPYKIAGNQTWKNLSAGYYHSLGIDINDDLYSFGYNYYGQLGLGNSGPSTNRKIPTKVSTNYIENNVYSSGAKWTKVSAGAYHSLAIDSDNKLFTFGSNAYGSLGLGDLGVRIHPVMVGSNFNYLPLASGTPEEISIIEGMYTFSGIKQDYTGPTKYLLPSGEYIISGVTVDYPIAILNAGKTNLISYSGESFAGSSILAGTTADGMYNFYYGNIYVSVSGNYDTVSLHTIANGYMGGENMFHYSDPDTGWQDVSAGNYHSLAIKNGQLYSFGHNTFGQLGNNSNTHSLLPVQVGSKSDWVKVRAGNYHSLAIDSSGSLWSFGANNYGQLGVGNNTNRNNPTKVSGIWQAFEDFNFNNLFTTSRVGFDDEKYVFNYFANKQYDYEDRYLLSNGSYIISGVPSGLPIAVLNEGKQDLISYSGTNYYDNKTILNTTSDGTYNFYWGDVTINVSGDFERVSTYTFNSGYMGGENIFYHNRTLRSWNDMSAGVDYSVALDSTNQLWAFGKNDHGQLGLNDDISRRLPAKLPLSNWQSVDAGANHVLVVNSSKELWAFGRNNYGQLGLGDLSDRYEPTKVNSEIRWATPIAGGNHSLVTVFSYYPSSPTNIVVKNGSQVSAAGSKEIEISWTLNTSEEEGILNYIIQYSINNGSTWGEVTKPVSINKSYVFRDPVNHANPPSYIFRVAAVNYVGQGAFSANSSSISTSETSDDDFCNVVFMSHLDGDNNSTTSFKDLSQYNWTPTIDGSVKISTDQSRFGGASAYFDGGAGLTFGSGVEFNMNGDFTIECFFRPISYSFNDPQALLHGNKLYSTSASSSENGWGIYSDKGVISVQHKVDDNSVEILRSNITLPLNTWSHVAWVRNGSVNSIYINGNKRSISDFSTSPAPTYHDTKLDIGTRISTGQPNRRNIYGYIDEVRISKLPRYSGINYPLPTRSFGVNTCS
jgi:alpha-tubulin suppressor-like RCC1 family protein